MFNFTLSLSPHGSPQRKKRTVSKHYLAWFAARNPTCCVPGCTNPAQLDHAIGGRSRNSRCSDFLVFNNCGKHHIGRSRIEVYESTYGVSVANIILSNWTAFAKEFNITGTFTSQEEWEAVAVNAGKYRRAA